MVASSNINLKPILSGFFLTTFKNEELGAASNVPNSAFLFDNMIIREPVDRSWLKNHDTFLKLIKYRLTVDELKKVMLLKISPYLSWMAVRFLTKLFFV